VEGWRTRFSQAVAGVRRELRTGLWDEDALVALWTLIQHETSYQFDAQADWGVDWSQEDREMVQQLNRRWIDDVKAEGIAIGEARGLLRAKRAWLRQDIEQRFGALPESLAARLEATTDDAVLDRAKERLSTAHSLSDLPL